MYSTAFVHPGAPLQSFANGFCRGPSSKTLTRYPNAVRYPTHLATRRYLRYWKNHGNDPSTSSVRRVIPVAKLDDGGERDMVASDDGDDGGVVRVEPDSTRVPELEALDPESGSVTLRATFNLAGAFLFIGGALCYKGEGWLVLGLPITAIGTLLAVQTFRLRFVFGPTRLSVAFRKSDGLDIIRGWEYDKITNWELWWKPVPILAYFKESESYNGRGSVHFFPILCDGKQLLQQFRERTPHLDKSKYD